MTLAMQDEGGLIWVTFLVGDDSVLSGVESVSQKLLHILLIFEVILIIFIQFVVLQIDIPLTNFDILFVVPGHSEHFQNLLLLTIPTLGCIQIVVGDVEGLH